MKIVELQGTYNSADSKGPGQRLRLELKDGRFHLQIMTWVPSQRRALALGEGTPIDLLGTRNVFGAASVEGPVLILQCEELTDKPGQPLPGLAGLPPRRIPVSDRWSVEIAQTPHVELRFVLYGKPAHLFRSV